MVEWRVSHTPSIVITGMYFSNDNYLYEINNNKEARRLLKEESETAYGANKIQQCLKAHKLVECLPSPENMTKKHCDICGKNTRHFLFCHKCNFVRCQVCVENN